MKSPSPPLAPEIMLADFLLYIGGPARPETARDYFPPAFGVGNVINVLVRTGKAPIGTPDELASTRRPAPAAPPTYPTFTPLKSARRPRQDARYGAIRPRRSRNTGAPPIALYGLLIGSLDGSPAGRLGRRNRNR